MNFPIIIIRASPLSFLGASGVIFKIVFNFSMKANRIAPDGTPRSAASHLGYSVCLCPIKGTPGLNELMKTEHDEELR